MNAPAEERRLREDMVRYCRMLSEKDYAPGTSGNVSARLPGGGVLVTPTGLGKWRVAAEDLLVVDLSGKRISGPGRPTSELDMHLSLYAARPDAAAVVHAHPPTATGFACAGIPLDQPLVAEFVEALGCAPIAPFGTPGTAELSESLAGLAKDNDAILLANHGAVTLGKDLFDAFAKMELVEHCAKITLTARQLGRERNLAEADVLKLLEARAAYFGLSEKPPRRADCPVPGTAPVDSETLARVIRDALKGF